MLRSTGELQSSDRSRLDLLNLKFRSVLRLFKDVEDVVIVADPDVGHGCIRSLLGDTGMSTLCIYMHLSGVFGIEGAFIARADRVINNEVQRFIKL